MNIRPSLRHLTLALSAVYAAVFIGMLIVHPGGERFYTDFHNSYQILAPLFAAVCGISYAYSRQHDSRITRAGWLLIGLSACSFALGQIVWTLEESVLRLEQLPSPGPADIGYLGAYPLLIAGVLLLFGSMHIAGRIRMLIDGALAASSIAVLSWYFLVSQLWHTGETELLGKLISVAYPLGDVAALMCAMMLFSSSRSHSNLRRSPAVLAGGIVLLAFADTAYSYYNLHDGYQTGSWFDWGWSFGWLLIGYASLLPMWWPQHNKTGGHGLASRLSSLRPPALLCILAPYFAVAVSFAIVVAHDLYDDRAIRLNLLLLGATLILLVIFRQVLTLIENQHLTKQLRSFNANLEKTVVQRTEQLTALLHLTKAVNSTLQIEAVVVAALEHTRQALNADGVVIRFFEDGSGRTGALPRATRQIGLDQYPQLLQFIESLPLSSHTQVLPVPLNLHTNEPEIHTYLRAPLRWQHQLIGMIGVLRWAAPFTTTDQAMLESIGVEVGTAMENARLYATALEAADHDWLTGLYNHRAIHQRLAEQFKHARQYGLPLTVMMMDVNNFKLFNDTYGHPVGDQVLRRVAELLTSACRQSDILGRFGGDEFIVVLPATAAEAALTLAERLRCTMEQEGSYRTEGQQVIPVTLSIGVATFPIDSENCHELLAIADANLYAAKLSGDGVRDSSENQRANRKLRAESTFEVLDALVTAIDNKDQYTRHHSEDVTEYAHWIGQQMGLSEETLRIIRVGCLLHDIGKIGVPDEILRKPGRLTPEEQELMKRHPRLGALIVGALPGMENILDIVRAHHERWDGHGYPEGLRGEDIPLLGRVAAVADAFSAMTTDRPYRKGMRWVEAVEEIRLNSGKQFDPAVVRYFIEAIKQHMPDALAPDMAQIHALEQVDTLVNL